MNELEAGKQSISSLSCPYCDGDLEILPGTHPEFASTQLTYDGTRKWFLCTKCEGVFCFDKLTRSWKISPATYTKFVQEGKIPDRLEQSAD
jgi:hypothetical protein